MHFDKVIDGEDRERNPYRGCGRRSDFQKHHADDSDREHDLEIDRVASRNLYLAIKLLAEIHDRFGTVRGAGQILAMALNLLSHLAALHTDLSRLRCGGYRCPLAGPVIRCRRLRISFRVDLSNNVVHVLLGLGDQLARLAAYSIRARHSRLDQRIEGRADLRQIFWHQHRADPERKSGYQSCFEDERANANYSHGRHRGSQFCSPCSVGSVGSTAASS